MSGWIGVDLDGTLAMYDHWRGPSHIGAPIPLMVARVKRWLDEGTEVRILTARVCCGNTAKSESEVAIQRWCLKVFGKVLKVTAEKDYYMHEFWDDRCKQVVPNTGIAIEELLAKGLLKDLEEGKL